MRWPPHDDNWRMICISTGWSDIKWPLKNIIHFIAIVFNSSLIVVNCLNMFPTVQINPIIHNIEKITFFGTLLSHLHLICHQRFEFVGRPRSISGKKLYSHFYVIKILTVISKGSFMAKLQYIPNKKYELAK